MGLGMCNITKCCTEVCPEHIKITDNAIIPLKERVVDASYDPVAWLGRKILRRTKRSAVDAALDAPGLYAPTAPRGSCPHDGGVGHRRRPSAATSTLAPEPVTRFLSPEWVDAFNGAVADVAVPAPGPDAGWPSVRRVCLGQVVTGGPDGEARVTLRVDGGLVTMEPGEAPRRRRDHPRWDGAMPSPWHAGSSPRPRPSPAGGSGSAATCRCCEGAKPCWTRSHPTSLASTPATTY